jgi:guanosine-3',5'-bis(diphosphate) 3'-pyrophosphohydrolase
VTAGAVKEKETLPAWISEGLPERLDRDLLARAYRFSEKAHEGQKRLSGDKFVSHCVEVAKILVDLQLDTTTVASGLIHDVVEDTAVTVDDIEAEFGKEIAEIVDGLTKIGHLPLNSSQERQVENYRKLLLSIAKDARVILIKLADRLHNMRTLEFLPAERQFNSLQRSPVAFFELLPRPTRTRIVSPDIRPIL